MRIDSSGNVGIGTTSPFRQKLDVSGNIFASNSSQIQITGTASSKGLQLIGQDDGTSLIGTMGSSGEHLLFRTASNERMRLLVGGPHLLLGGTASVNEITESAANAGMVIGGTGFGNAGLAIITSTSGTGRIYFGDDVGGNAGRNVGQINYGHSDNHMRFVTASTERMRLTGNGSLLVGCTATPSASVAGTAFISESSGRRTGFMSSSSTSEMFLFQFFNPNGGVGSIRTNGSATSFVTSSDYRLKENATAMSDGITRLKTLKPYRFNFKADADTTLDGFFAHEVQSVVPEAISGTKDEVDSDNNPVYQGIDQSKLVPLLTAALQEAVAEIETLKTKVAALEAA